MKKLWYLLSTTILLATAASAQNYVPVPVGAYVSPSTGVWDPLADGSGSNPLGYVPPPAGLYCQVTPGGAWTPCTGTGGGSASLPTATVPGQIITAAGPGQTYNAQGQLFFEQSTDTIASINAQCSSPCTEVVTVPETFTLGANTTLNANVNLQFQGNGSWTINGGGFTLTVLGQVAGPIKTVFPAGTGSVVLSVFNALVPVEWFGAVGDWNGTTGTNNLTPIQNTINAITGGQVWLQPSAYAIGGTLAFKSHVGMVGTATGRGTPSEIVETTAGSDAIDLHGASAGSPKTFSNFQNFTIASSVAQTGTAAGLSLSFTGGVLVENVSSNDFFYPFYIHASPSFSTGGFYRDSAGWGSLSSAMTSPIGWFLDSADGNAENSLTIRDSEVCGPPTCTGGPATTIGMQVKGTAINDVNVFNFNVAGTSAPLIVFYTGSATGSGAGDVHFASLTADNFVGTGVTVQANSEANAASGKMSVTFVDTRIASGAGTTYGINCVNANGVVFTNSQIQLQSGAADMRAFQCNDSVFSNNFAIGVVGNVTTNGLQGNTLTNSTISGNHLGYGLTNGINLDSTSTNIRGLDTNSFDSSLTLAHQVVNVGVNNPGSFTAQTAVSCSTSGTATFSQPEIGLSRKQVIVYFNACVGTFSYTFPTAFSFAPQLVSQSITTSIITSISTTVASGTGSTTTGFAELDGY